MTVVSFEWLLWMTATVAVYWLLPARWRDGFLIAVTLAFVARYAPLSAAILVAFAVVVYWGAEGSSLDTARTVAIIGFVVAVLLYFKIGVAAGVESPWLATAIPLGLSYYSFRCLHYVMERYKGALPAHDFRQFASYLFFLPTFLVGPIHRFPAFQKDHRRKHWEPAMLSEGLERLLYGYVKINLLGNYLVTEKTGGWIAGLDAVPAVTAYLGAVAYAFELYFMFAGFSDVAIGFAMLLGYRVMENFDWPFIRRNISEFWNSWHISLSLWCRDYVYAVVVANTRRAGLAAVVAMLVLGLWHELSPRYLVYGLYHGLGIVAWQMFQALKRPVAPDRAVLSHLAAGASIVLTFHFVVFGFVLIREPTLADALAVYGTILTGWG